MFLRSGVFPFSVLFFSFLFFFLFFEQRVSLFFPLLPRLDGFPCSIIAFPFFYVPSLMILYNLYRNICINDRETGGVMSVRLYDCSIRCFLFIRFSFIFYYRLIISVSEGTSQKLAI